MNSTRRQLHAPGGQRDAGRSRCGADFNGALVQVGKLLATHDVRDEERKRFRFLVLDVVEENKYLSRGTWASREAAEGLNVLVLEDAAEQMTSPSFRRIFVFDFALTDD